MRLEVLLIAFQWEQSRILDAIEIYTSQPDRQSFSLKPLLLVRDRDLFCPKPFPKIFLEYKLILPWESIIICSLLEEVSIHLILSWEEETQNVVRREDRKYRINEQSANIFPPPFLVHFVHHSLKILQNTYILDL